MACFSPVFPPFSYLFQREFGKILGKIDVRGVKTGAELVAHRPVVAETKKPALVRVWIDWVDSLCSALDAAACGRRMYGMNIHLV